jgi:hypothetical protein
MSKFRIAPFLPRDVRIRTAILLIVSVVCLFTLQGDGGPRQGFTSSVLATAFVAFLFVADARLHYVELREREVKVRRRKNSTRIPWDAIEKITLDGKWLHIHFRRRLLLRTEAAAVERLVPDEPQALFDALVRQLEEARARAAALRSAGLHSNRSGSTGTPSRPNGGAAASTIRSNDPFR